MITVQQIHVHIQPGDWLMSVNLKDAYFHIQIASGHRSFLWFAFEDAVYQFNVIPFGLALAPSAFTKSMNVACLAYHTQYQDVLESHKHQLLDHSQSLGLSINAKKSVLQSCQSIAFLGLNLDSRVMRATCLRCMLRALAIFKPGDKSLWSVFRGYWDWWQLQRSCAGWDFCIWGRQSGQLHVMVTRT